MKKNAIKGKAMNEGDSKHCSYVFVYVYLLVQSDL